MSIMTITFNPAIDQTIVVDSLQVGAVHRALSVHYNAGGKGIMVASCLADWGQSQIIASGLLGKDNAEIFCKALNDKHILNFFISIPGANRTNIKIVDQTETTDLNLPGIEGSEKLLGQVIQEVKEKHEMLILSGSLASGMADNSYQTMINAAPESCKVILDASGNALIEALKGPRMPYCVKPNELELSQWAGRSLDSTTEILAEAKKLLALGVQLVVISMGGEGAYFLSNAGIIRAFLQAPEVKTTVGAGDAMVAGIVAALAEAGDLTQIARLGTAFAVGTLGFIGPHLPSKDKVDALAQAVEIKVIESNVSEEIS